MKIYGMNKKKIVNALRNGDITVSIYGLGKMGLPLATVFAENGAKVVGVDINNKVVETVNNGVNPIEGEEGLDELVQKNVRSKRLVATSDAVQAAKYADVMIIIVPTYLNNDYTPDLEGVKSVCRSISCGIKKGDFVILESTAPPGTTDAMIRPILEKSGLKARRDFGLAHCPERTYSSRAIKDITGDLNFKIVGGIDSKSTQAAAALYSAINKRGVVCVTDAKTAEAVKVFEGIYRDVNIALANELALVCDELGIDAISVFEAANTDRFCHILKPGCGVGGHCIPVYPYFILKNVNRECELVTVARKLNDSMPHHMVELVSSGLREIKKKIGDSKILTLGLSFRGGVKEKRKSPAIPIIQELKMLKAKVYCYDPLFTKEEIEGFGVEYKSDFRGLDCIVIVTDHQEFRGYDWEKIGKELRNKVIVDGRQIVDPARVRGMGYIYRGIGHL
jgi:UDP-N-acetyl-D-mannosaminuronic acid dehydrogenase